MNKDEVLRRAQDKAPNKMDEMELDILNKGCKIGVLTGLIVCVITMVIKMFAGVPYYDVYAIYCFMVGAQWFYKWSRLKTKRDLYLGFSWCGLGAGIFIGYLTEIFLHSL